MATFRLASICAFFMLSKARLPCQKKEAGLSATSENLIGLAHEKWHYGMLDFKWK